MESVGSPAQLRHVYLNVPQSASIQDNQGLSPKYIMYISQINTALLAQEFQCPRLLLRRQQHQLYLWRMWRCSTGGRLSWFDSDPAFCINDFWNKEGSFKLDFVFFYFLYIKVWACYWYFWTFRLDSVPYVGILPVNSMESCCASEFFAFMHSTAPHRGLGGFACFAGSFGALLSSGRIQVDCRSKQECGPVLRFLFFHRIESDDQRFERELAECGVSKCHQIYTWTFWHFFGTFGHFASLCTFLHIFALGGAESIGGHWLIRLRVAGGCYQHSLGVENRGLVGWCLVVPCLNCSGLMWLGRCQLIRNFFGGQWRQFSSLWLLAWYLLGLAGLFPEDPAAPKHSAGSPVRDRHRSWGGTFVAESHGKLTEIFLCHRLCLGSWQTWQAYDVYEAGQTQIVYTQNWVA